MVKKEKSLSEEVVDSDETHELWVYPEEKVKTLVQDFEKYLTKQNFSGASYYLKKNILTWLRTKAGKRLMKK